MRQARAGVARPMTKLLNDLLRLQPARWAAVRELVQVQFGESAPMAKLQAAWRCFRAAVVTYVAAHAPLPLRESSLASFRECCAQEAPFTFAFADFEAEEASVVRVKCLSALEYPQVCAGVMHMQAVADAGTRKRVYEQLWTQCRRACNSNPLHAPLKKLCSQLEELRQAGSTLAHLAARAGGPENHHVLTLLCEHKQETVRARLQYADLQGRTLLHWAAQSYMDDAGVMQLLLSVVTAPAQADCDGVTAYSMAVLCDKPACTAVLREYFQSHQRADDMDASVYVPM